MEQQTLATLVSAGIGITYLQVIIGILILIAAELGLIYIRLRQILNKGQ